MVTRFNTSRRSARSNAELETCSPGRPGRIFLLAPAKAVRVGQTVEESSERQEVLDLTLIQRESESFSWLSPIIRVDGRVEFGARQERTADMAMYTIPVRKIWAKWGDETSESE